MPPSRDEPGRPELLFRDRDLAVVYKPAGMLVHRSALDRHEDDAVLQWLRDRLGCRVYPVHRLDKPTAGLLAFALNPPTAARLERQFAAGGVDKRYLAVVRGHLPDHGCIDHPLGPARARGGRGGEQAATTEYACLDRTEVAMAVRPYASSRYSLLEVRPRTGRLHQIRRHMKHLFHPLVGDTTYGDGHHNRALRRHFDCRRLMLVSVYLAFEHPTERRPWSLRVEPDADFRRVLAGLGLALPGAAPARFG